MAKHFFYLTNDKLVCLRINGNDLVGREVFGIADTATPDFGDYVQQHARLPTYLVTDLIEEDFRLDTIPHLRGGDQEAVLERRLGQIYRASPYRHAIVQGREDEGRRDDKVFLHAVTNSELLKPLLATLERAGVPLEGIYSSAVSSAIVLKELELSFAHTLLVTIIPDFGLRQTYFKDKQIKFSRLTPVIYDESRSVGELIAAETSRTWQYLDSLRFFAETDSLEVCMLIHQRDRAMMVDAAQRFPMLRYRFLDISEVAAKLKIAPAPTSSHAEEILSHLYARNGLTNHFATPQDTRFSTFRRTRIAVFGLTAVILAIGAAGAAFNLVQATQISAEIEAKSFQERNLQREFQGVANSMREQKMATDTVRDTSTFFNSQVRPTPAAPGPLLNEIADVVVQFPVIRLNQIVWMSSNEPTFVAGITPATAIQSNIGVTQLSSTTRATPAAGSLPSPTGAAASAPVNPLDPPLPGNKYHIAEVSGTVELFDGDTRRALADIDRFVARLQANPDTVVKVTRLPVDVAPTASLKVIDRSTATATQAPFTIQVARKVVGT